MMTSHLRSALSGALAGVAATVPMSAVMVLAKRLGLMGEHPPKIITEAMLEKLQDAPPDEQQINRDAVAAHFGTGAVLGTAFALLQPGLPVRHAPVTQGALYGLLVWVTAYKGVTPMLGIMPPPEKDRSARPAAMIAAHIVFGAALGVLLEKMRR